jgi:hypothetical protein
MRLLAIVLVLLACGSAARADEPTPVVTLDDLPAWLSQRMPLTAGPAAPGQAWLVVLLEPPATLAAGQQLLDGLRAARLDIVDSQLGDHEIVITVALDGVRAAIKITEDGGEVWLVPRPVASAAPKTCTPLPMIDLAIADEFDVVGHDGVYQRGRTTRHVITTRSHDLDGDGILDAFVPLHRGKECAGHGRWKVYLVRAGGCAVPAGQVGPGEPWIEMTVPPARGKLRPIETRSVVWAQDWSAPEKRKGPEVRSTYAGARAYARTSRQVVQRTCHHCATENCKVMPKAP